MPGYPAPVTSPTPAPGAPQRRRPSLAEIREALRRPEEPERRPGFDPTGWNGALVVMLGAGALLWVIQVVNSVTDYALNRHAGLYPREVRGLWGIVTEPFLHSGYGQLFANTAPFVLIGWVLLRAGVRTFLGVTGLIVVLAGVLTWLVAPAGLTTGASVLVFGWLGYLLARAYFSRSIRWIVTALTVLFFFGALLGSLLPSFDGNATWEAHAAGFVAGVAVGWVLHPRRGRPSRPRTPNAAKRNAPPVS